VNEALHRVCNRVLAKCLSLGSADNMSIVLVLLHCQSLSACRRSEVEVHDVSATLQELNLSPSGDVPVDDNGHDRPVLLDNGGAYNSPSESTDLRAAVGIGVSPATPIRATRLFGM